ncbi:hypothetical protein C1752_18589 [Acaryochloris thomasi RCC1774]|uniref:Uncharacterized protein n=1 Tax=Acaryochloris thomasi RCC1774 TaxID=1764569 RepID=A0A2W1JMK5_9CYAN|nr:hypothetical protein C1752_18589 [Acaryochloris thomasi RCC1774]
MVCGIGYKGARSEFQVFGIDHLNLLIITLLSHSFYQTTDQLELHHTGSIHSIRTCNFFGSSIAGQEFVPAQQRFGSRRCPESDIYRAYAQAYAGFSSKFRSVYTQAFTYGKTYPAIHKQNMDMYLQGKFHTEMSFIMKGRPVNLKTCIDIETGPYPIEVIGGFQKAPGHNAMWSQGPIATTFYAQVTVDLPGKA